MERAGVALPDATCTSSTWWCWSSIFWWCCPLCTAWAGCFVFFFAMERSLFYTVVLMLILDTRKKGSKWNKSSFLCSIVSSCVIAACTHAYNFFPSLPSTDLHWKMKWKCKSRKSLCSCVVILYLRTLGQICTAIEFSPILFTLWLRFFSFL